jgi:hypothetical protein
VGRMRIAEQTEGAGHRSENNTGHLGDARRTYGPAYGGPYGLSMVPLWWSTNCTTLHLHEHQRPYYILNSVELI